MKVMNIFLRQVGQRGSYAGIGARNINNTTALESAYIAFILALHGLILRSGGAGGNDTAYEFGAKVAYDLLSQRWPEHFPPYAYERVMQIFLPWDGFNGRYKSQSHYVASIPQEASELAKHYHPQKQNLKGVVLKLMARNCQQVLGRQLDDPSRFVSCFTPDGVSEGDKTTSKTGGTGQAIRLASAQHVPVYNTNNDEQASFVKGWIDAKGIEYGKMLGLDLYTYLKVAYDSYTGTMETVVADLVDLADRGEIDVLVHGANCFRTMKSGIAASVVEKFPEARDADLATSHGDIKKLGTYSSATVHRRGKPVTIVNAYTQFKYGRDGQLYADYLAIDKVFKSIRRDFSGKIIGYPRIGAGLASGDWVTISNTISCALKGEKHKLVVLPEE